MIRQVLRWHPNGKLAAVAAHRLATSFSLDRSQSTDQRDGTWSDGARSGGIKSNGTGNDGIQSDGTRSDGIKIVKQWKQPISERHKLNVLATKLMKSKTFRSARTKSIRRESSEELADLYHQTAGESPYLETNDALDLKAHLKRQLRNVDGAESLGHVLQSIGPAMSQLESAETFFMAFQLFSDLPSTLDRMNILSLDEAARILASSSSLRSLLERANSQIDQLDGIALTALFRLLVKIKQPPEDEVARNTIEQLTDKLDELSLKRLSENLFRANFYADRFPTEQLVKFRGALLESTRTRILNTDELDPLDVELVEQLFYSFLLNCDRQPNFEMVERLVRMLLSPDVQLDFTQAANALRLIRLASHSLYRSRGRNALYPQILADLIDQCNTIVYNALGSNPANREIHYTFLDKAHRTQNKLYRYFANIYDPQLLDRLTTFLLHEHMKDNLRRQNIMQIWALAYNYSKLRIYNEQLVQLFYQLVTEGKFPSDEFAAAEYNLLTAYRWPFVDHQHLVDLLKSSKKVLDLRRSGSTYFGIMCQLILTDACNPELLYHLSRNIFWRNEMATSQLVLLDYNQTTLARAMLSSKFSELNDEHLKGRIMRILDEHLHQILKNQYRPRTRSNSLELDQRLQEGCFLSNGVLVNAFAIYDQSIGDLLPLDRYERQFEEIDRIQLASGQKLLAFIKTFPPRGSVSNYDANYDYQLRKLLQTYDFKTIDVPITELSEMKTHKENVQLFIDKALESYG